MLSNLVAASTFYGIIPLLEPAQITTGETSVFPARFDLVFCVLDGDSLKFVQISQLQ